MFKLLAKFLIFAVIIISPSIWIGHKLEQLLQSTETNTQSPSPTVSAPATPTQAITPTISKKVNPLNQNQPKLVDGEWERTVEGNTTWEYAPKDDHMSTPEELFNAVNAYRRSQALPELQSNGTLCSIAQNRAKELQELGKLDNHAGMDKYAHGQQEFDSMSEVLYGGVQPQSGTHIVEWGWDRSLTGHRDALQNRSYTHGCAGIAGYFAVFIFGGGHI